MAHDQRRNIVMSSHLFSAFEINGSLWNKHIIIDTFFFLASASCLSCHTIGRRTFLYIFDYYIFFYLRIYVGHWAFRRYFIPLTDYIFTGRFEVSGQLNMDMDKNINKKKSDSV